jgi:subtilisin family serine protease
MSRPPLRLLAAAVITAASAAKAEAPRAFPHDAAHLDRDFVALLARAGSVRHPLADASGRLPLVVQLSPGESAGSLGWLPYGPGFATLRVAPADLPRFEADHPGVRYAIWPALHARLDQSAKLNGTAAYRAALAASGAASAGTGKGVVVGVIDTGIDARHPDFLDGSGHTRVAWILDMAQMPMNRHPELETAFGCNDPMQSACAILDNGDIDEAIAGDTANLPRDIVGHGTHVTSIAAGNDPNGRYVGGAPEATLVIAAVAEGASGAVTDPDIATGARFIFDRADAMGMPAIVNLSLGGDFGPHDGRTALEQSLREMVSSAHPGHAIVVAAGNSGTLYQGRSAAEVLGIHTELRTTSVAPARAPMLSPGQSGDPSLSGSVFIWVKYGEGDRVAVGLSGPNGIAIAPVDAGDKGSYASSDGRFNAVIANGIEQDPALPPSGDAHGAVVAWNGRWPAASELALEFRGEGVAEAWITTELDNGDTEPTLFEHALLQGTVNVPATDADLIAVGCTVNRTEWTDADQHSHDATGLLALGNRAQVDDSCIFSSAGPAATGATKPEISAPGALVAAAMSRDAAPVSGRVSIFDAPLGECVDGNHCFVVDENHALLSGSSMSAPQVAGAVALLFERDPSLVEADISRLLQQGARRPTGSVPADYQLGTGALDVRGAVAALALGAANGTGVPDPTQSWMSLSDGFAHPDPSLPVTGTVALRTSDGGIADGFETSRLGLEVGDSGSITMPLARIAPGLWRFAFSARPGTGQAGVTVAVRFDGVAIGQGGKLMGTRTLPIGADRWIAVQGATAFGGCAVARRGAPGAPWVGVASVLLATAAWAGRLRGKAKAPRR